MRRNRIVTILMGLAAGTSVLSAQAGMIATVAGGGAGGLGGPATSAQLISPAGIRVDAADNFFVADTGGNRVLRVDAATGIITLAAGNGTAASSGDFGPATQASLFSPRDIALDAAGNVFIVEMPANRIRRVDAVSGIITTAIGTGTAGFSGDGGAAGNASLFFPTAIAFDLAGNLYIADSGNARIRRVDSQTGIITTVAGNGGTSPTQDGVAAISASFAPPFGVGTDQSGNVLITEYGNAKIRRVDAVTGILSTVAGNGSLSFTGDGVPAAGSGIGRLIQSAVSDAAGNLFFADGTGRVRRVDAATGVITTVAGNGSGARGMAAAGGGGGGSSCMTTYGDNGPATSATLDGAYSVALTHNGNLLIGDAMDCRVRRVFLPSPLAYTNTTLTANPPAVQPGNPVMFTATVSPINAGGTATGSIQFVERFSYGGGTVLGTASLNGGTASLMVNPLGSYPMDRVITAVYSGDGLFNGSGAPDITASVSSKPAVVVTLSSSQNPATVNTPTTVTVTVAPPQGSTTQPTGSVQLWNGSIWLPAVTLVNGSAQFSVSFAAPGTYTLAVSYSGDSNYVQSSFATLSLPVTTNVSVSLTSDMNPSGRGATVTFTAAISPSYATGAVQFRDGATALGTVAVTNGSASLAVPNLFGGNHVITAVYSGDSLVPGATSPVLTQVVQASTTTTLASPTPSTYLPPVTFTASVAPSSVTGQVTFRDGATVLGASAITSGTASLTVSNLGAGPHSITATYDGDASNLSSTSSAIMQSVAKATPAIKVSTLSSVITVGQTVFFNIAFSPAPAGATLSIMDGETVLAVVPTSPSGAASYDTSTLTAGYHSITAAWAGDANVQAGVSPVLTETVQSPDTLSVTATTGPLTYGQPVTFTATVSPSAATGTFQFSDGGSNYGTIAISGGQAAVTVPSLNAGNHLIAAGYSGDGIYFAGIATVSIDVAKVTTTTSLAASPNPSTVSQAVALTATVSPSSAIGQVEFYDGTTLIGVSALSGGTATVFKAFTSGGSHSLTAVYTGGANYTVSTSPAVAQTVKVATTTTVTGAGTSTFGQSVDLAATVSPSAATGTIQFLDGATPLGTVAISGGSATLSVPAFSVGSHSITAIYSGDSGSAGSTSAVVTHTVQKAGVTFVFGPSDNPSVVNENISIGLGLTPATATGTVQFLDGATVLGTFTLINGNTAMFTSTLAAGSHSLSAVYSGDANYNGGSTAVVVQVVKPASSTTIGADTASPVFGQTFNIISWVTPSGATGTVRFNEGTTVLGTVALNNGVASLPLSTLSTGSHTIYATYSGDATYFFSTSAPMTLTIGKASPTVALASSLSPSSSGQSVTFTATLSASAATGTVQFLDGSTALATVAVSAGGATFSTSALGAGSHTITAAYGGDGNFNAASGSVAQSVKTPTTTAVTSNNASAAFGQTVQFTATVTPAAAGGTVQFLDGAVVLGSVTLSGGAASLSVATLAVGSHAITAVYGGDAGDTGSTSAVWTQTIGKAATSATLSASPNPSVAGQSVTLTAAISPAGVTGSVQFFDGGTSIGTGAVSGGSASLSISSLTAGSHSLTAVYSGDANYSASTSVAVTQVVKATSTVTVTSNPSTSAYGQPVAFTAAVSPSTATGTVQFFDGTTSLGTAALSGGTASLALSTLAVGTHSITAVYSGDTGNTGATSAAYSQTVVKANAAASLSAAPNPSAYGQAVTLSAAVSPSTATGTVQFFDGGVSLGTATISGGTASLATSTLGVGTHSLSAVYSGDANFNAATSGASSQTMAKANATASLTAAPNPSAFGQAVTLSAAVSPATATGTVQFFDGATSLGTAAISGGTASLAVSTLAVGTHSLTGTYSGDSNYNAATSNVSSQTVAKANATASLSATPSPSTYAQSVTLTATIVPSAATGSVQFFDGATSLGTANISGGTASLAISTLTVGTHSLTAAYGGNANYNAATSAAWSQTVSKIASTVSLAASPNPSNTGQSVTFTATVSPSAATGSVEFFDGSTSLGTAMVSAAHASKAVSTLAAGTHSITAVYSDDATYATSTSAALTQAVNAVIPGAPSNLTATTASSTQINLTWTASPTSGVTYNVYSSSTSNFTPAAGNRIATGVAATSYSDTGLAASTTHYYRVKAQNSAGESTASNQASATTQAIPSCHVVYSVSNQWTVGFTAGVTIKNTGTAPINGWTLTWSWSGNQQITQSFSSLYSQTGANATLRNESYNPTIAASATLTGVGFNASYTNTNPAPTAFYLNGTLCH